MQTNNSDCINYRLQQSDEAFADATLLADNERWRACVNRLYYACFYAVSALLLTRKIETYTHSGCKTQFALHFVKTGTVDAENAKLYIDLMDWRQKGDYDLLDLDEPTVKQWLKKQNPFCKSLKAWLGKILRQTDAARSRFSQ